MDLPLCICGIFFLYDRRNAGFAAENSAVAGRLFQSGSDDCHGIFLCLVQLQALAMVSLSINGASPQSTSVLPSVIPA